VLTEHQQPLCATFAATGADKFADVSWTLSTQGLPVLDQVLAWIDCEVEAEVDSGDHTILIGRVVDLAVGPGPASPLLFFRGQFGRFSEAPSDIPQH
jgi:flavin reductase (DIM6/NTAB) family NADH-FMN oxidoreductase RutF